MAAQNGITYSMTMEVYLQSAVVRGTLVTNQDRLSNYLILREGDEVFRLRDATLEDLNWHSVSAGSEEYLIYMQEVFVIADLSPQFRTNKSGLEHLYVQKEPSQALLGVGPYWVRGDIHRAPGGALHDLLLAKTRFIPVTDATMLQRPDIGPRTYLINRAKIGFLKAESQATSE